jgi:ribA/ribD-fused uncharacterized protein
MKLRTYTNGQCAQFMRSRDQHGDLSNMTFGFPLEVNRIRFQGPEGLYQALKFTDPAIQRAIASHRSGMEAKKEAYRHTPRSDWDDLRLQAMLYTLGTKFLQHPARFGAALLATGNLPIVECSYRDDFWGAKPNGSKLKGQNQLGRMLTDLRDHLRQHPRDPAKAVSLLYAGGVFPFTINGQPVPATPRANPAR